MDALLTRLWTLSSRTDASAPPPNPPSCRSRGIRELDDDDSERQANQHARGDEFRRIPKTQVCAAHRRFLPSAIHCRMPVYTETLLLRNWRPPFPFPGQFPPLGRTVVLFLQVCLDDEGLD